MSLVSALLNKPMFWQMESRVKLMGDNVYAREIISASLPNASTIQHRLHAVGILGVVSNCSSSIPFEADDDNDDDT